MLVVDVDVEVDVDPVVVVLVVDDVDVVVDVEPVVVVVEPVVVVVHGAVTVTVVPGAVTVTVFVFLGGHAPSLSPRRRCALTALLPTTIVTSRFEPVRWHITTFFGFFFANDAFPAT